ncbi:hypothetical protein ACOSP7_014466 [Xanthoceras sorbifolium]
MIVRVIELESGVNGSCLGNFLRVKVEVDVSKTFLRGLRVALEEDEKICSVVVRYESLPNFCYYCGKIGYLLRECPDNVNMLSDESRLRFGLWTKALGIDRGRGKIGSFLKPVPEKEGNLSGNVAKPKENGSVINRENNDSLKVSVTGVVGRNGLENVEVSDISVSKGFINGIYWNQLETMIL